MGELKNELSWSKSRDETFRKCQRQYYFQYYGSWNGWSKDAPARTREIYLLKKLQTRQLWAGSVVHDRIKLLLETLRHGNKIPAKDTVIERTLAQMRDDFKSSREKRYQRQPKTLALFEHEYDQNLPAETWKENADHVVNCLETFLDSETLRQIQEVPTEHWLESEELSHFIFEGTKVYVVLDFSYRDGDEIVIYDWKTGKRGEEAGEVQLACYALYASGKWDVPADKIRTVEFNLPNNKLIEHHLGGVDTDQVETYIRNSIGQMQALLLDEKKNVAEEDSFGLTENERNCNYCNYRKVCPRFASAG